MTKISLFISGKQSIAPRTINIIMKNIIKYHIYTVQICFDLYDIAYNKSQYQLRLISDDEPTSSTKKSILLFDLKINDNNPDNSKSFWRNIPVVDQRYVVAIVHPVMKII